MQAELFELGNEMVHWYKRDPDAALNGMAELSLADRGAYNSLLDLLYSRDGDVPDDDVFVSRAIRCHWREWRRAKAVLIAAGKVWIEDGKLTAKRVQKTLTEFAEWSEAGRKRAAKRWQGDPAPILRDSCANPAAILTPSRMPQDCEKPNQNNDPSMQSTSTSTSTPRMVERDGRAALATDSRGSRRRRLSSLPEDFIPTNLSDSNREEFERFKDHACTHDRRCADWAAAWRNWLRKAPEFNQQRGNGNGRSVLAAADRLIARLEEAGAGDYVPGSSGPKPLEFRGQVRPNDLKLISSR